MKPFLHQIASLFYSRHGVEVDRFVFVFPNRRAGVFFQKYLAEVASRPLFSPTILTINDLFVRLSGKQVADRIKTLFLLYEIYVARSGSSETFDDFLYWGEMLLNDFDDIDKYMVDAGKLFSNITDLHEIESLFDYLSPEQIAAIRSFWSSFYPKGDSPNQREFLALWEILHDLYTSLREWLAEDGQGYEGMIFREVVEDLQQGRTPDWPFERIVVVGLNALSTVEIQFLKELQRLDLADFYWDYDSPYARDPENKASFFASPNLRNFPSKYEREEDMPSPQAGQKIKTIGVPSGIGQAKQVYYLLKDLCARHLADEEEALRTAIVLPDENLLVPVLNAIPEEIRHINVTMGYPLAGTPVASLMESIFSLQKNIRYIDRQATFYFRDVLPVLNHQYISLAEPEAVARLQKEMTANNRIYLTSHELGQTPLLKLLFTPMPEAGDFSDYLIRVLEMLNKQLSASQTDDDTENDLLPKRATDLEQEFIFHYFATVNRMKEVMKDFGIRMRMDTYFRLLKKLADTVTIPFHGEPLSGLQIMGVLETRALDFDRLIILSMNEGIFPLKKVANSFIPYNLRRGFGLPTYEHQDSVWAYHFYRLIYRAKEVTLLYDTRSNGLQTGEKSRFIHQLHYHYRLPMEDELVVYDVVSSKVPPISIAKDASVCRLLEAFRPGRERAISASAVNTYLDCPLKFYFSVLENVQEEEEVSETIGSDVFGSILHKVMEILYQPLCGKMVTADLLKLIRKDQTAMTGAIAKAFAEVFFKTDVVRPLSGQNYLIGEMIRKYVLKVLERDSRLTPFQYVESERRVQALFSLSDGSAIQLKGFIDRIDQVKDRLRIVDYKSGNGTSDFASVPSLFDRELKDRPKAVMQVFMYAWMYDHIPGFWNKQDIQPAIYYMRTLFSDKFDASVYRKEERKRLPVECFGDYAAEFESALRACLDEIFNPELPFVQTTQEKVCSYCQFRNLCGK